MRPFKMAGLCLTAAFALMGLVATTASAAVPEFGRCVKVAAKTGEYSGAQCLTPVAGNKGRFDWQPGPGALKKFEETGEEPTLETVGGRKIVCTVGIFTGEFTGPKTESVSIELQGCVDSVTGAICETAKKSKIETLTPLEGEIGFIKGTSMRSVGLDLKHAPVILTFECGKVPETVVLGTLEGSVIAPITPIDKMAEEFKLPYKEKLGKQIPEQFEGGAKDTLTATFVTGLETTTQQAGLKTKVESVTEEPIEIKAK
jgi:hypothetical protein